MPRAAAPAEIPPVLIQIRVRCQWRPQDEP
jgi:hypothetical protein